ncbi:MAG: hypothetical protein AABX38_04290 [Candidatus Micrarchaeota archaeon]
MKFIKAMIFAFTDSKVRVKAFLYSIGLFLLFAIPTALLSNPIIPYVRMIPATPLDYIFLVATSILSAVYILLPENKICTPDKSAFGGGVLGFIAFSCPTCNRLLVLLFGFGFMYDIINPIRPILGILSIIVLLHSINKKAESSL